MLAALSGMAWAEDNAGETVESTQAYLKAYLDTMNAAYYTLDNDTITSITEVVGQRSLAKLNTSTKSDVTSMTLEYSADPTDPKQAATDIAKYFQYVTDNDDFIPLKFSEEMQYTGGEMSLAKNSVDDGKVIVLDINYDSKGYTLIITKVEGTLTLRE